MLQVRDLRVSHRRIPAVQGVSLEVPEGRIAGWAWASRWCPKAGTSFTG